jgi:membrane glycosyltransferase
MSFDGSADVLVVAPVFVLTTILLASGAFVVAVFSGCEGGAESQPRWNAALVSMSAQTPERMRNVLLLCIVGAMCWITFRIS